MTIMKPQTCKYCGWQQTLPKLPDDYWAKERKVETFGKKARHTAKTVKKFAKVITAIVCAIIAFVIVLNTVIMLPVNYKRAEAAFEAENYAASALIFGKLGDYRDAKEKALTAWDKAAIRETISAGGNIVTGFTVGLKADGTVVAVDDNEEGQCNVSDWKNIKTPK